MGQVPPQPQPFNIDIGAQFAEAKPAGSRQLLEAIGHERKGTVLSLFFADFLPVSPMLTGEVVMQLEPLIIELGKVNKLDLILRSTGGVAEIPWRIVSELREFCDESTLRTGVSGSNP